MIRFSTRGTFSILEKHTASGGVRLHKSRVVRSTTVTWAMATTHAEKAATADRPCYQGQRSRAHSNRSYRSDKAWLTSASVFSLLGGGFVRSPKNPALGFETSADGASAASASSSSGEESEDGSCGNTTGQYRAFKKGSRNRRCRSNTSCQNNRTGWQPRVYGGLISSEQPKGYGGRILRAHLFRADQQ